jgi:hypothetical protein
VDHNLKIKQALILILNLVISAKTNDPKDNDELASSKVRQTANSAQSQSSKVWAALKQNYLMRFLIMECAVGSSRTL